MIGTYMMGIGGMVTLIVLWVLVQSYWRKIFSAHITDEDVLAGRSSCGNCGCLTSCKNKQEQDSIENTLKE
ncbi:hypothetical protein FNH22_26525 [Fulvivirga sp. M361]|uniref:hypothetical protein n=1 Tax=Fulvivirga sp. M361 TaxID=2594266 RepID=UPI00117B73C8|nr:hypothetical protein [Fulvivirga sp. M361]TRX49863.1 hypothetical protein FNH22_26525 [Fulvivirga sp. M361]